MRYLVSNQQRLFNSSYYQMITVEESLLILSKYKMLQFDTETKGLNSHLGTLLSMQLGSKVGGFQIVIDCTTISPLKYKEVLENSYLIGHNLKFDLQWLYKYDIIPLNVYDTMIVEQMMYLNYPEGVKSYSLRDVAWSRLKINIDKSVRGQIIREGLTERVILYAAGDVEHLEDIMYSQLEEAKRKECIVGAKLECDSVPWVAYLEWCGIKLDEDRWKEKMRKDNINLQNSINALNDYVYTIHPEEFIVDNQGDLFTGFNATPKYKIDWNKTKEQVIPFLKKLGFNVSVIDKKSGKEKESAMEKVLSVQKGIDDTFLKLYFDYQGYYKVVSSFGQGHLNSINPITGRLHTNYWQLGAITSRMSSGGGKNKDVAAYKHISVDNCPNPNMQQLPHDAETRACFVAEKGNLFCSCDYSAAEARMGAEIYNEKVLLDEFLYGSGDTHAAYAKQVFVKELEGIDTKDIKKKRPDLRNKVKAVEFAVQFGSDGTAAAPVIGCTVEKARKLVLNLLSGMKGLAEFKKKSSMLVKQRGYVLIHPLTGHKLWWWDIDKWRKERDSYDDAFWNNYRTVKAKYLEEIKKGNKVSMPSIMKEVKNHFQVSSLYDRYALNAPTQGSCAIVIKDAMITLFRWIVENGYFRKVLIVNVTHDEANTEFPEELKDTYPKMVSQIMQDAAAKYFKKLPIPAEPEVGNCWIH